MSKNKRERGRITSGPVLTDSAPPAGSGEKPDLFRYLRTHIWASAAIAALALVAFAGALKYLEEDAQREMARNSKNRSLLSSVNPFMPEPPPSPTPQLSKEYVYAGSRYDENGNLTEDPNAWEFRYDAAGRQTEAEDDEGTIKGQYFYDGEGRRVKKISSTETTIFVYDAVGKICAEYSTALAQTPQVSYLTSDHLGSPRIITNQYGEVTSRKDFTAFGEETITSQRTSALGYNPPSVRRDYAGFEKDQESGLEYAQARYYNSQHGRFTSVDPLAASASAEDPQTLNRYSYALNSPYKFTDPLGLLPVNSAACGQFCANHFEMNSSNPINGAVSAAAASGISWSLFVWEAYASGYALTQPNSTIVFNGFVIPLPAFISGERSESGAPEPPDPPDTLFMQLWKLAPKNNQIDDIVVDKKGDGDPANQCALRFSYMLLSSSLGPKFIQTFTGAKYPNKTMTLALKAQDVADWWTSQFGKSVELKGPNIVEQLRELGNGVVHLVDFQGVDQPNQRFNHIDLWNAAAVRMSVGMKYNPWFGTARHVFFWSLR